jgi:ribosome-binding factor A
MTSGADRSRRVAEQIQRFLSSHLVPDLRDPRLGFATVTGVEVTRDLRAARVYVTIYDADPAKRRAALDALNGAAGRIRREIAAGLNLRYAPSLRFDEDLSVETADRVERLIQQIHQDDPTPQEAPPEESTGEDDVPE